MQWLCLALPALLIAAGLLFRLSALVQAEFWVDEAESSLNGLTIRTHGYPVDTYMGLPLYENTLIEPWAGHPEYEFRDSSYRPHGLAVYHGWLPLYSIAAAQALFGVRPDPAPAAPHVRHTAEAASRRGLAARVPALIFSAGFLVCLYRLTRAAAGAPTAVAALAWAALSERAVLFGYPARYYAATLFVTTFAAWMLWRSARNGRWSDFLLLGVAEGLLFHTHQLSAVVFSGVILCTIPALLRVERWKPKLLAAFGVVAALTIPWALATGFLSTAALVPKVPRLFATPQDWLQFVTERPRTLLLFATALVLLALARIDRVRKWPRLAEPLGRVLPAATVLVAWIALAYAAIHLLVPAASFFPNRLTLMMQVPGILLVGCVFGVVAQVLHARSAPLLAGGLSLALLVGTGRLAPWHGLALNRDAFALPAAEALRSRSLAPDTRIYASPNDQLLYQYLHGLPVQSVAPVRRSFFESYPGPIVFLETRHAVTPDLDSRIRVAAAAAGVPAAAEDVATWRRSLWERHAARELAARGLPVPPTADPPPFLSPLLDHLRAADQAYVAATRRRMPIFRDVQVETPGDLWLSFSYRFVDYANRLGVHANIHPRLQRSTVELLPDASVIVFHCAPLTGDNGGGPAPHHPPREIL